MATRGIYSVDQHPTAYFVVTHDTAGNGYVPAVRVDCAPSYRAIPVFVGARALKAWALPLPDEARIWEAADAAQRTGLVPGPLPSGFTRLA